MSRVGLLATAHHLPERVMTAAEVAAASGIPEPVVVERFGLSGKHVAADDEHVSDLAVAAAGRLLEEHDIAGKAGMFVRRILPFALVGLVVLPFPKEEGSGQVFDFFYAVLVFQLCVVLALGSIAFMRLTNDDYVESMLVTLLAYAPLEERRAALRRMAQHVSGLQGIAAALDAAATHVVQA